MVDLARAYAACERDVRAHYENFPVASLLLPRSMRPHVAAVYAFARSADDFADEGTLAVSERLRLLAAWRRRLRHAVEPAAIEPAAESGEPPHAPEIFAAVGATIRAKALPVELFEDLLSAFEQDVTVSRYATWADVLDYCRRSANPVGRLVLRIAGYRDERLDAWSDAICTALQLTNFWQDVKIDFERGRIYLPAEEMRAHGAAERDLAAATAGPAEAGHYAGAAWSNALSAAAARTRALFTAGRPLCDAVPGRLRHELRATWLGGMRILDRVDSAWRAGSAQRPRLSVADAPWFAARMMTWSLTRRPAGVEQP